MVFGFSFTTSQTIYCQDGCFKYFKNYSHKEYDSCPQNWSIVQDRRGVVYIGNACGLLEYDGVSWRKILIPNRSVFSLAIDDTGTVYIGGKDEIGFLAPDAKGVLQYKSLIDRLEDNQKNFSRVWKTHSTEGGIYFRATKFLFRWNDGQIKAIVPYPAEEFNASFACGGILYIRQDKIGLRKAIGDRLEEVAGGEIFAEKKIFMMSKYNSKKLLIGTRENGFYIYDGIKAVPFPTEADGYVKKNQLYHGIRLSSSPGDFALATRLGGLVIIDSLGRLKYIFNEASGLQNNNVRYVFEDAQSNLWMALDSGISKIEYTSPISIYDKRSNLPGLVLSVTRHGPHNELYAGTSSGLYSFASPSNPGSPGKFHSVPGMSSMCWSLLSIGDSLLAATNSGTFQIKKNKVKMIIKKKYSYILHQSKMNTNRIWVGTSEGLFSLCRENGQWVDKGKIGNITQEIRTIVEDNKKGILWLGTLTKGVLKVNSPGDREMIYPSVAMYDTSHGLPEGEINIFMARGDVMFATEKGIYRFDEKTGVFLPDASLGDALADGSRGVFRIVEDKNNHIWLHSEARNIEAIPRPDGIFFLKTKPFLRIPLVQVNAIYPDPVEDNVWFAGNDGLISFNTRVEKNYNQNFNTLIRRVVVNGNLLFDGFKCKKKKDSKTKPEYFFPIIDYKDRNLRFEFAAPFFESETKTQYQCLLEGYDDDWSSWTLETQKEYTNLDSGTYTFRVRAKNVYRNIGKEAAFQFKVSPPWYQTWWAYLLYAAAVFFGVFLLLKWRSRKLILEKEKLEHIIHQRTREIENKNRQLQDQSEKLKEMDKIKSRFFANISHEFRTPLTLLMGPLEQMIAACTNNEEEKKRKLTLMFRNAQRLLRLINQLLELSKLESGKMKLHAQKTNIVSFVKGTTASFQFLAHQKEMDLVFHTEEDAEDIVL